MRMMREVSAWHSEKTPFKKYFYFIPELTICDRDRDPITDRDHFFGDRDRIAITFGKSDR